MGEGGVSLKLYAAALLENLETMQLQTATHVLTISKLGPVVVTALKTS